MNMITRLLDATEGSILLDGEEIVLVNCEILDQYLETFRVA